MKRHSIVGVALVAAVFVLSGCKKDGVTFNKKAPPVGQKFKQAQKMDMNMSMTVDLTAMGKGPETTSVQKSELITKTAEVLANNGKAATKLKVTYDQKEDFEKEGDKEKKVPSPIAGKTYIVEAKDGKIVVTNEQGQPVPEDEALQVELDNKDLGQVDSVSAALPDRALKVGEEVPELSRAIEAALTKGAHEANPKAKVSGTKVKLREDKGDVALFDVAVLFSQEEGPMTIKMDLTGTLGVRKADAQPTELSLKGPVSIDMGQGAAPAGLKIDGKGDMSMSITAQYL